MHSSKKVFETFFVTNIYFFSTPVAISNLLFDFLLVEWKSYNHTCAFCAMYINKEVKYFVHPSANPVLQIC